MKINFYTMKFGLIILALVFFSCTKDNSNLENSNDLIGKWTETQSRMDTLSFESLDNLAIMNLNRGKEIRNENLVPKLKSGTYVYKIIEENISLRWILSSNSNFNDYYFKISGNKLNIGNFYGSTSGETLSFEKLD
tara:strand:+ start:899 stop:1306 length:408 start_codon:yes stop_codon:yes gene_type:complete